MDSVGNSKTTRKTRLSRSEINSIKRQEKNEAFSKNNGDKTTNYIPSQKANHVGSSQNKKSYASSLNGDRDSKVEKQVTDVKGNTLPNVRLTPSLITPALVLDDSCVSVRDLSRHVMGRVKDLNYIPNLRTLLTKEGFSDVKLAYLGGMWVMIELDNEATKLKLLQHIGFNSWFHVLQATIHDFVSDERVVWVDIEGVPLNVWSQSEYISDDESLHGAKNKSVGSQHREDDMVDNSDAEGVFETFFGDKHPSPNNSVCNISKKVVEQQSEDPFCIYDMLNKKPKGVAQDSDSSLSHPPGFTPEVSRHENDHRRVDLNTKTDKKVHENVTSNGESAFNYSHNAHNGGSILEVLDDMIRSSSRLFNHFITSSGLVDVKLEGYSFTWAHPSATKMRKLDRFLVSKDTNRLIRFKKKLQDLKKIIHSWIKDKKLQQSGAINSIKEDLID
nr:RNA-directed DNA polymerase, eukaryota, reverse transcriptase zinc-binding domain protein [Tanacetum cinerariifolium]